MGRLMKYIRPHLLFIIVTLGVKFAGTYVELWIPSLMETLLDDKVGTGDLKQV